MSLQIEGLHSVASFAVRLPPPAALPPGCSSTSPPSDDGKRTVPNRDGDVSDSWDIGRHA